MRATPLLLILLLLVSATAIQAQNVEFYDENFKQALINNGVDTDGDMEISYDEAEAVTSLYLAYEGIMDFTGLEAFVYVESLEVDGNDMNSIDLTALTGLQLFRAQMCSSLSDVFVSGDMAALSTIELGDCSNLMSLDVSELYTLETLTMDNSSIESLKLPEISQLSYLSVNMCYSLTELDLSAQTQLVDFYAGDSMFETLDLSNCSSLGYVYLSGAMQLIQVCVDVVPPGFSYEVDDDSVFQECGGGGGDWINIPDSAFLQYLIDTGYDTNGDGGIDSSEALDVYDISLQMEHEVYDLTGIEYFVNLTGFMCQAVTLETIDLSYNTAIETLQISNNSVLTSLTIGYKPSVSYMELSDLPLVLSLDLSQMTSITFFWLTSCGVGDLVLPQSSALTSFSITDTPVSAFDFDGHDSITDLDISGDMALTELDVRPLTNLSSLSVENCMQLTQICVDMIPPSFSYTLDDESLLSLCGAVNPDWIDIPDAAFLAALIAQGADLNGDGGIDNDEATSFPAFDWDESLAVDQITDLSGIEYFQAITDFTMSNAELLQTVDLSEVMLLYSVSLTNMTAMDYFAIPDNPYDITLELVDCDALTTLDLSQNPNLYDLTLTDLEVLEIYWPASNNIVNLSVDAIPQMTEIDMTSFTVLGEFAMHGTDVAELDLRECTSLSSAYLTNNPSLSTVCLNELPPPFVYEVDDESILSLCLPVEMVYIPDPVFLQHLIDRGHDLNADGGIDVEEAAQITEISFAQIEGEDLLTDLTGIESFINMTSILIMGADGVTSIDLSQNTALTALEFQCNDNLAELLFPEFAQDAGINIWASPLLTSLDLSTCSRFWFFQMTSTGVTELIWPSSAKLVQLTLADLDALTALDISGCGSIETIYMNDVALGGVDLRSLEYLQTLTLTDMPNLTQVCVDENPPTFTYTVDDASVFNLCLPSVVPSLDDLLASYGYDVNDDGVIDVIEAALITDLDMDYVEPGDLSELANLPNLASLTITSLQDTVFIMVDCQQVAVVNVGGNLRHATVGNCPNLNSLGLGGSLTSLGVTGTGLTGIDLSGHDGLVSADLSGNDFGSLDLSYAVDLETLDVSDNPNLYGVDASGSDALSSVRAENCPVIGYVCVRHPENVVFVPSDLPLDCGPVANEDQDQTTPEALPTKLAFAGASPNPFNPSTRIAFDVPVPGNVRLEIYDLASRRVAVLMNRALGAGRHEVVWTGQDDQGRGVSSGVYLCRLTTAYGGESLKVLLSK